MTKLIPLSKNSRKNRGKFFAVVDDRDFDKVSGYNWSVAQTYKGIRYAVRTDKETGKTIYMHREIVNPNGDLIIDHRDGDGLNNVRANIRTATLEQNGRNKKKYSNNTTGYIGVTRCNSGFKIEFRSGETIIQKYGYKTPEQAAKDRDELAVKYHGEFASLNFPQERTNANA